MQIAGNEGSLRRFTGESGGVLRAIGLRDDHRAVAAAAVGRGQAGRQVTMTADDYGQRARSSGRCR